MRLNNGTSYHVPTRAFASDSQRDEAIRLSNSATHIDVRPTTTAAQIDVRPATEERH
jgi:hypothetical protein